MPRGAYKGRSRAFRGSIRRNFASSNGDILSAAQMMYGGGAGSRRVGHPVEEDQYGRLRDWFNPFTYFRGKPIKGMNAQEYREAVQSGAIMAPTYDMEEGDFRDDDYFAIPVSPKDKIYGIFDSVPRKKKGVNARAQKKKKSDIVLF